jgi:hypothetical protein
VSARRPFLLVWRDAILATARLPWRARLVGLALASHADSAGGSIRPSVGRLAAEASIDERTVRRAFKDLVDAGFLQVVDPGGGRGRTALYQLRQVDLDVERDLHPYARETVRRLHGPEVKTVTDVRAKAPDSWAESPGIDAQTRAEGPGNDARNPDSGSEKGDSHARGGRSSRGRTSFRAPQTARRIATEKARADGAPTNDEAAIAAAYNVKPARPDEARPDEVDDWMVPS